MTQKNLTIRVENLESAVAELAGLPRQMEGLSSQFLQLREDVREEISGVHSAMATMRDELRGEMTTMQGALRGEMTTMRDELRDEIGQVQMELAGAILSTEKRLSTEMRTLHEDLVKRIALISETRPAAEAAGTEGRVRPRRSHKRR